MIWPSPPLSACRGLKPTWAATGTLTSGMRTPAVSLPSTFSADPGAVGMPGMEADMGGDGDTNVGHAPPGRFVADAIQGRHHAGVRRPHGRGRVAADAAVAGGAEIER